jgi:hypothetical protein
MEDRVIEGDAEMGDEDVATAIAKKHSCFARDRKKPTAIAKYAS